MNIPEFKCRASKASLLTVGYKKIDQVGLDRIAELEKERDTLVNVNGNKGKWTDAKQKELATLQKLKANPELGQSIKTYLEEWVISQLTGKKKEIESKYLNRGIACEDLAFQRIGNYYGTECIKNTQQFENEYFTGEFDTLVGEVRVIDAKCPWDAFTFPYFDETVCLAYNDQEQVYMDLTGLKLGGVAYCLENGTDEEIEKKAWKLARKKGIDEPTMDEWNEATDLLNYDHLPEWMRIKVFEFAFDQARIDEMKARVLECRTYINTVILPKIEKLKF